MSSVPSLLRPLDIGGVRDEMNVVGSKNNQYTFCNLSRNRSAERKTMDAKIEIDGAGRRSAANACTEPCAIERGMRIIGGKWTGSILWHVKDGPVRFNGLARMIGGASKKMITERLRQLENQGLVRREVCDTAPITVVYEITDLGRTALGFLDELRKWSEGLQKSLTTEK